MSEGKLRILAGTEREALRARLLEIGFAAVRFAAVEPTETGLSAWLAEGRHADMAWMERSAVKRDSPGLVLPGVKTVIALGVNYGSGRKGGQTGLPRWARYALHEDYHETIRPGLVAAGQILEEYGAEPTDYRWYVDTGPVLERGWAARAGLGFLGKNAMVVSPDFGNWLFLSAILTRVEIEPDVPLKPARNRTTRLPEPAGLLCGKCTRCMAACPTQAFPSPGVVDARLCISYQTIENKGIIPRELRAAIGDRVYGCDTCLEVCPWNRFAQDGRSILLAVRGELADIGLEELLVMTPERFAVLFRGTAVKRLKLAGLLRNACVVAGNSGRKAHLPGLVDLASHPSPVVRAHAVWAIRRLVKEEAEALLASTRALEADPMVLCEYAD